METALKTQERRLQGQTAALRRLLLDGFWRPEARPVQRSKFRLGYDRMKLVLDYGPRVSSHRRLRHSFHLQAPITNVDGGCLLHDDSFITRALYA
jgi:hypothetical protein